MWKESALLLSHSLRPYTMQLENDAWQMNFNGISRSLFIFSSTYLYTPIYIRQDTAENIPGHIAMDEHTEISLQLLPLVDS